MTFIAVQKGLILFSSYLNGEEGSSFKAVPFISIPDD